MGVSNKEMSKELGLPPSTCSRILSALCKYDFAYKQPNDSRFFLGYAHLRFAQTLMATSDEVSICRPHLDELYRKLEQTVQTVFYAKFNGNYCVVIDVRGAVNTRIAVGLGELMPLHCSAAGKAVLSFIPEYERRKFYKRVPFDRYTTHTIVDEEKLEQDLLEIQRTHISYNYSEFHEGINALAVPVFNSFGKVAGSLAIVGTAASLTNQLMKEKGQLLLSASKTISKQLIMGEKALQ